MVEQVNTYSAVARPEEGGWDIEVVEADGSHTWAPTLRKARQYAREVAAAWFELPVEQVEVELTVEGARDEIASAREKRAAAERAAAEAAVATEDAVRRLSGLGLPDRDVAVVVGLSHQRVHQLRSAASE